MTRLSIYTSLLLALMVMMLPLPNWAAVFRPDWLALVIFYWAIALPKDLSFTGIWLFGLLSDVAMGSLLGQHTIGYLIMAYSGMLFHRRIRVFPLWQQAPIVGFLLAAKQTLVMWIDGISGIHYQAWFYYATLASSTLLWPWVFVILRDVRRKSAA